jgi:hypothetical protein
MLCPEATAPLVLARSLAETETRGVPAGFGVTGRKLERAPRTGAAIEMPAAVAALRVEVGDELCERALVQVLAIPCEDGARLPPAGILLAEAIHRFPPETAAVAMNRRPRSSMEARSTPTRRLKNNGFSSVVSR